MVAATKITNNKNNANNTSVMRMLAQLNTVFLTSGLNQIKSLKAHTPQQLLSRPTNVPPTMPTTHIVTMSLSRDNVSILTRRNKRISSDFVMRFLRPSVKRPQTEKMRSTKACDAGALIRSYAKDASRGYTGIRCSCSWKAFHQCGDVQGDQG